MRNQPNNPSFKADKRFDELAKKQEREHQHALSGHNKEMQQLRLSLNSAIEKFESISSRNDGDLADFKDKATYAINLLRERVLTQENTLHDQKNSISSLQDQILNFQVLYSSMRDLNAVKKQMEDQIKEMTKGHLCSLQDLQREFKDILSSLKNEFTQFKENSDKRLCEQSDRIEARFYQNKMDREGVLKEIKIREKDLFVIEKKIENIYTLIERINNKRG